MSQQDASASAVWRHPTGECPTRINGKASIIPEVPLPVNGRLCDGLTAGGGGPWRPDQHLTDDHARPLARRHRPLMRMAGTPTPKRMQSAVGSMILPTVET
jgi:hypothetical protein